MNKVVDILWTGGWDSTFRVIYAALVEKAIVRPHYIIDFARNSSLKELQAISDIREELAKIDFEASRRIESTNITPISEVKENEEITGAYTRLKMRAHLGSQYDWLARYANQEKIADLELSVHVDDKAYFFLSGKVEKLDGKWRLGDPVVGDERLFSKFSFPILEISKTEMRTQAEKLGFLSALEKSWFCFNPMSDNPCGLCNPCIYAVEEGMSYRLPKEAISRYRTRRYRAFYAKIKSSFKKMLRR